MRVALIGRSEILFRAGQKMLAQGHEIALIVTAKEAPEYTATADDFRKMADELSCRFLRKVRLAECIEEIRSLGPLDIGISANFPGLVPQEVIDCFRLGVLNAHGGDLPRYRGNACQAWAIINGEDRVGLCVHQMVGGELDSGDIVARDYHPVTPNTKVTELWTWMTERAPELFEEAVTALSRNPDYVLERQSDDPQEASRCYPRRPEDGRIDWSRSALDILRLINASNKPYAGAFCQLDGETIRVWDAELVEDGERFLAVPGQVTKLGPGWVQIATGSGKIQLNTLEKDGQILEGNSVLTSLRSRLG